MEPWGFDVAAIVAMWAHLHGLAVVRYQADENDSGFAASDITKVKTAGNSPHWRWGIRRICGSQDTVVCEAG